MNSRMDKYHNNDTNLSVATAVKDRTSKNKKLYEEVQNMNIDYIDVDMTNATILSPEESVQKTRSSYQMRKELERILPSEKKEIYVKETPKREDRVYDINEILRLARDNKLFEDDNKKRLINTEYNILTKLDIDKINGNEDLSKDNLRKLINKIYMNEDKTSVKTKHKRTDYDDTNVNDLFSELMEDKQIEITPEVSKNILDKNDDEKSQEKELQEKETLSEEMPKAIEEKSEEMEVIFEEKGKGMIVAIIIVVLLLVGIGVYLFLKYFGTL